MSRREFLTFVSFLAATSGSVLAQTQAGSRLTITEPGCSAEVFAPTYKMLREWEAASPPLTEEERLQKARAWLGGNDQFRARPCPDGSWRKIQGPAGTLKLRIIRPQVPARGVVISIHGGGWATGEARSDEQANWKLSQDARVVVVSPEYRLAPEHPYPAGPEDCLACARWVCDNAKELFGADRLGITGNSAGSHLAVSTLLGLDPARRRKFRAAALYYGVYHLGRTAQWSQRKDEDHPDLSPTAMKLFVDWFLPKTSDKERSTPEISPLLADLPKDLPPGLFLVGSADLLAPDSRELAQRWAESGTPAELVVYPGGPHGFNGYDVEFGLNPDAYRNSFLARHLSGSSSPR